MAAAEDDFEFLLDATTRLIGEIRAEVEAQRQQDRRGTVLADYVLVALAAIERKVTEEEARYPKRRNAASKRAGAVTLRFLNNLVWATHTALGWLQPNPERQLDLGALYFADEIALSLIGDGIEVNPVASGEYMYSTSSWPFIWLSEDLEEPKGPPIPIVLTYPEHESEAILLHCLFAHELAHPAVGEQNLVPKALEGVRASGEYDSQLAAAVGRAKKMGPLVEEQAPSFAELWIEELLCDALAFGALGPSYLFAFAEVGLSVGLSEPDHEHPSMALRSRLLIAFAKSSGWQEVLKERVPRIYEWIEFAAEAPSKLQNEAQMFADWICRSSVDRVIELAEQTLGARRFTPEEWETSREGLLELLDHDVLPVEVGPGEPASHAQILLACWFAALANSDDRPSSISKALGERDYQRFVAKALEMSTVVRVWPKACTLAEVD